MFTKDKIEAIDHKNPPVPLTPEKLKTLNEAQSARDAAKPVTAPQSAEKPKN